MDNMQFSITGLEPILAKMAEVKLDVHRKGGRFALRKAAMVALEAAQANARKIDDPATAEKIEENLVIRFSNRRFKRTGDLMFRIGVLGGAKKSDSSKKASRKGPEGEGDRSAGASSNPGGDTFHWRFVELGTSQTRARPFLRPALERNINKTIDVFATEYDKALGRAIKRAKKAGK